MPINSGNNIKFRGFSTPNYTQVPDELFDDLMVDLSGAELKVLLYIIRRTFGFKKAVDNISISQLLYGIKTREGEILDKGTGLSKKTLLEALKSLVSRDIIISERRKSIERGNEPTAYRLNIASNNETKQDEVKSTPTLVVKTTPRASSKNSPTQETGKQETDLQIRNSNVKTQQSVSERKTGHQQFQAVGELLKSKLKAQENGKSISYKEIPEPMKAAIQEISTEFGDARSVRSNTTHAYNIFLQSKKSEGSFVSSLYEAKSITKQQGSVKKKMPYFFSVLEDLAGIKTSRPVFLQRN